jgi:uncharacterized protein YciI
MRSRGSNDARLRRDDELSGLRAGQRSVRLHLSARRPERPKPVTPLIAAADTHAAALAFQRELTKLTSKMLRKKLFIATFTSKVGMDKLFPMLPAHLEYMIALTRKGVLFAAGPVNTEKGTPTGGGLALFNTATADEARRYAEGDPFYQNGLRSFEIHEWVFMEGSMTVTLNFAEGTLSVT